MRYCLCAVLLAILAVTATAGASRAEFMPLPALKGSEDCVYYTRGKKKEQFINTKWGINPDDTYAHFIVNFDPKDPKVFSFTIDGEDKQGGRMITVNRFQVENGRMRQVFFGKKIMWPTGKVFFNYEVSFSDFGKLFPEDIYSAEVIPFIARGMDFNKKTRYEFYWWASERSALPLYAKVKTPQKIKVPAGEFNCYGGQFWGDLNKLVNISSVLTKLINPFMPVYVFWVDMEPPHRFVRFEGSMGPPGTPEICIELAKIVKNGE